LELEALDSDGGGVLTHLEEIFESGESCVVFLFFCFYFFLIEHMFVFFIFFFFFIFLFPYRVSHIFRYLSNRNGVIFVTSNLGH